jgi:peptide/nickel transport system permease protein
MSLLKYTARRGALAAVAALVAISLTFLVVATNRFYPVDTPLTQQYADYVLGVLRLEFGYSESLRRPVSDVLVASVPRTLAYVVPAILFTYTLGILGGLAAAYGTKHRDTAARLFAYVMLGVPTMVVGSLLVYELMKHTWWASHPQWCTADGFVQQCWPPFTRQNVPFLQATRGGWGLRHATGWPNTEPWRTINQRYLLPAAVLSVGLATGLFRQARRAALEHRASSVSKMLAAKGASDTLDARHAVRNAALPLLSVSFAELMSVFTIWAFVVEAIFHVPGITAFVQIAVRARDLPLLVGTTVVLALLGVAFSFLQDVLYGYLDPEVGES